jgi:SAM-dependent methyltransferase
MDKIGHKTLEIMSKASWYNKWLLSRIQTHLKGEILEVGAGMGNFTKLLSKFGNVTAIDYDSEYKNTRFGDIEKGIYYFGKEKRFDSIVCMNVLEHIKDDRRALRNMFNLLSPGGRLILLVPAFNGVYSDLDKNLGHFRRYKIAPTNKKLQEAGFSITDSMYLNWLGLIGWFVNGKVFKKGILPEKQLEVFDIIARPLLFVEKYIKPSFGLSVLTIGEKGK